MTVTTVPMPVAVMTVTTVPMPVAMSTMSMTAMAMSGECSGRHHHRRSNRRREAKFAKHWFSPRRFVGKSTKAQPSNARGLKELDNFHHTKRAPG
jgi:hypothetical protein